MPKCLLPIAHATHMWKILGKEAMYLDMANVWRDQILAFASEKDNFDEFKELMDKSEVMHLFNGSTEVHTFIITVPDDYTPEQIQAMADMVLAIAKDQIETPFVEVEGKYQKCQVIISNEKEPELIGMNRTEGYASGKIFMPILTSLAGPGRMNESNL